MMACADIPIGVVILLQSAYSLALLWSLPLYIFVWLINNVCMAAMPDVTDADSIVIATSSFFCLCYLYRMSSVAWKVKVFLS